MYTIRLLAGLAVLLAPATLHAQAPPAEEQIAAALQAAPEAMRQDATVLGWTADGTVVTLREGDGAMVCLADDPRDDAWSVACYHKALEPYMARGRELAAQGVTGMERNRRRWREVEAGTLELPSGKILYVLHGKGYDAATNQVEEPYLRWVIYTPFATPESTGYPTRPRAPGEPWLMYPGTAGAHVMITPPRAAAAGEGS